MQAIIVGHGPSMMSKPWGPLIDNYDAVIRMKWGHKGIQEGPDHFGKRLEYLCSTLRTWPGYAGLPIKEYWGYENVRCGRNLYPVYKAFGDVPVIIDYDAINKWTEVYRGLRKGGLLHFSTGLAAIIMACVRLKPESLTLVGFDNTISGESAGYKSVFREPAFPYSDHQWGVEHDMVPLITETYGVRLCVMT